MGSEGSRTGVALAVLIPRMGREGTGERRGRARSDSDPARVHKTATKAAILHHPSCLTSHSFPESHERFPAPLFPGLEDQKPMKGRNSAWRFLPGLPSAEGGSWRSRAVATPPRGICLEKFVGLVLVYMDLPG